MMFCFSDKQELETDLGGRHENKKKKQINWRCGLANGEYHQSTAIILVVNICVLEWFS